MCKGDSEATAATTSIRQLIMQTDQGPSDTKNKTEHKAAAARGGKTAAQRERRKREQKLNS